MVSAHSGLEKKEVKWGKGGVVESEVHNRASYGHVHCWRDTSKTPNVSFLYLKPTTVCYIQRLTEEWGSHFPRCCSRNLWSTRSTCPGCFRRRPSLPLLHTPRLCRLHDGQTAQYTYTHLQVTLLAIQTLVTSIHNRFFCCTNVPHPYGCSETHQVCSTA